MELSAYILYRVSCQESVMQTISKYNVIVQIIGKTRMSNLYRATINFDVTLYYDLLNSLTLLLVDQSVTSICVMSCY